MRQNGVHVKWDNAMDYLKLGGLDTKQIIKYLKHRHLNLKTSDRTSKNNQS